MLDKIKNGTNIFVLFIFVVAVVYGIVIMIINVFNPKSLNEVKLTSKNIDIYMTGDTLVTIDYNTFFAVEGCIKDVVTALHDNKMADVYNILTDDMKTKINNDKSKLTEYYNKNFKYDITEGMETAGYQNYNNLKQLYKIKDKKNDTYICVVTSINEAKTTKIGIKVINNETFLVSYIDM